MQRDEVLNKFKGIFFTISIKAGWYLKHEPDTIKKEILNQFLIQSILEFSLTPGMIIL